MSVKFQLDNRVILNCSLAINNRKHYIKLILGLCTKGVLVMAI